jgi:hypothetical protein
MVAAVQDKGKIERIQRHIKLWPEMLDIVAICRHPELFESAGGEPAPWDQHDERPAEDWQV